MNIAILNHYASTPDQSSGEIRHFELAKRFAKDGNQIHIYIGDYSHLVGDYWHNIKGMLFEEESVKFKVIKTRKYTKNSLKRFLSSYDYYKNGKKIITNEKYDVIIASSPHPFTWSLAYYYSKKLKTPFYIEIRDVWPDDLVSLGSLSYSHPIAKVFDYMCKKYYPEAAGIISLIPDLSFHFKRLNTKVKNYIYIPNGIDTKFFEKIIKCQSVDKIIQNIPKNTIKIAFIGSMVEHNGVKETIELIINVAPELSKNFSFIFVGPGQEDYINSLKSLAKNSRNIFFFEPIPKKCVPHLMQNVDVLLFTLSENQMNSPAISSFKLLDYMASGKPILSVDIEGLLFKKTNGAIFFKNGNQKSFEKALSKLLKTNLNEIGKRNKEFIQKKRNWDRLYNELSNFIRNTINQ
ncbi:glycosyltransferase family 4 protein [Thermosipho ferrireducens]|uniref:Glycosyltransferase family 4 protein n=1 Tax=Thermosipho ferrireducens TaxID=2571116 RepID=A0ABX7S7G0_9BACT|nr:glycosyltransferase family 4 protein [Thermosipho ferrireducens]QTA38527.1 glycosyltransferase family 4 protein [Thermosipho ferrireducens]